MVLAKALADKEKQWIEEGDPRAGVMLPEIPLYEARQIMTRADFIQNYDQINVFTIDSQVSLADLLCSLRYTDRIQAMVRAGKI